jgi:hypothetical protein
VPLWRKTRREAVRQPLALEAWTSRASDLAAAPVAVGPQEYAQAVRVMSVPPDTRYRAARAVGLLDGLSGPSGGFALDRDLLTRARASGRLAALAEAVVQ